MSGALLGQLADAIHPGPQRAAHGVQQIVERRIVGQLSGAAARRPDAAQLGEVLLGRRFQYVPTRCHYSASTSIACAPCGLPRQELRLDLQIRSVRAQRIGDRRQRLEPVWPILTIWLTVNGIFRESRDHCTETLKAGARLDLMIGNTPFEKCMGL